MLRQYQILIGVLAALAAGQAAAGEGEPAGDSPEKVIEEVRTRNPQLAAIEAEVQAAEHVVPQVGSFPDPMFMVGLSNWPLATETTPLTGVQFELKQTFPWFGKLSAREDVARGDVSIRRAGRKDRENRLVARARVLLWELRFLAEHRKLAKEIRGVLDQFAQVAEAAYTTGGGRQQDLIKPLVEQHRIEYLIVGIDRKRDAIQSEINALRSRPPETPVQPPALAKTDDQPDLPSRKRLQELARTANPMLEMSDAAVEKHKAALRLAEKGYYPDFTVGLQYRLRWVERMDAVDGADFVGVTLGFNLPIFAGSKQGRRVEEARVMINAGEDQRTSTWDGIRDRIERVLQNIERDRAQARIYREKIIPDTRQALDSSLADYQAGRLEMLSVLDNLMKLFMARVDLVRRETRIQASRAELEYFLGGPLEPVEKGTKP
jgi:outer membrane protein TolC